MKKDRELVGNDAAAAYVGVASSTWRSYVNRKQGPAPDRREVSGGYAQPVWRQSTLDAWKAGRPGQGRKRRAE